MKYNLQRDKPDKRDKIYKSPRFYDEINTLKELNFFDEHVTNKICNCVSDIKEKELNEFIEKEKKDIKERK